jgi:hypothetical protein
VNVANEQEKEQYFKDMLNGTDRGKSLTGKQLLNHQLKRAPKNWCYDQFDINREKILIIFEQAGT